jgi:hypothetical protein
MHAKPGAAGRCSVPYRNEKIANDSAVLERNATKRGGERERRRVPCDEEAAAGRPCVSWRPWRDARARESVSAADASEAAVASAGGLRRSQRLPSLSASLINLI